MRKSAVMEDISTDIGPWWDTLRNHELFEGTDEEWLSKICIHARIKKIPADEEIFVQDEPVTSFGIVLKGQLRMFRAHENGKESIVSLLRSGQSFLEEALWCDGYSSGTIQTIKKSEVLFLPASVVKQQAQENKFFGQNLLKVLACRASRLMYQVEQMALYSAEHRLAAYILSGMLSSGGVRESYKLDTPKGMIAQHLGITAETLSRAQKVLAGHGIKIKQENVTLSNNRALCRYCDGFLARQCADGGKVECLVNIRLSGQKERKQSF